MSPRAFIIERSNARRRTWQVRYSVRGRTSKVHWGTFTTRRDAEKARDYVNGQLAVGRYPHPSEMVPPEALPTVTSLFDAYTGSYPARSPAVVKLHRQARAALVRHRLGGLDASRVMPADVQAFITWLAEGYAPATARKYFDQVKAAFTHAEVTPNPAASPRLRFPLPDDEDSETVDPPAWDAFTRILDALPPEHRLMALFIERHGLRGKEVAQAVVGDFDLPGRVVRIHRSRTKRRTGGQRQVPLVGLWAEYLHHHVFPPLEDRDLDAPAFPLFNQNTFRGQMRRASKFAGARVCSPHQLRHRYITLLMQARVDPALVARIAGHRKLSITQDIYTHVLHGEPAWRLDELRAGVASVSGLVDPAPLALETPVFTGFPGLMGDTGL